MPPHPSAATPPQHQQLGLPAATSQCHPFPSLPACLTRGRSTLGARGGPTRAGSCTAERPPLRLLVPTGSCGTRACWAPPHTRWPRTKLHTGGRRLVVHKLRLCAARPPPCTAPPPPRQCHHPCALPLALPHRRGAVDPDETVFFANWQQAAAAEVCARSADPAQRAWAATYACELQDDVAASGYYAEVATVSAGCFAGAGLSLREQRGAAGRAAPATPPGASMPETHKQCRLPRAGAAPAGDGGGGVRPGGPGALPARQPGAGAGAGRGGGSSQRWQ